MSSKKKMIIAISAFAMVVLAAVVAVVAVLAAQNVTLKSSINISYTVDDVVADVAVYTANVKTDANLNAEPTFGEAKATADFDINHDGSEDLTAINVTLAKDECVVIKFEFNNNSANAFRATLTPPTVATGSNITVTYHSNITELLASTTTTPSAVDVAAGADATNSYYAVIKIVENTQDVNVSLDFIWALA